MSRGWVVTENWKIVCWPFLKPGLMKIGCFVVGKAVEASQRFHRRVTGWTLPPQAIGFYFGCSGSDRMWFNREMTG